MPQKWIALAETLPFLRFIQKDASNCLPRTSKDLEPFGNRGFPARIIPALTGCACFFKVGASRVAINFFHNSSHHRRTSLTDLLVGFLAFRYESDARIGNDSSAIQYRRAMSSRSIPISTRRALFGADRWRWKFGVGAFARASDQLHLDPRGVQPDRDSR